MPAIVPESDKEVVAEGNAKTPDSDNSDMVGMKHYRVLVPPEVTNLLQWVSRFCSQDHYARIDGRCVYIDTLGECTAPGVEELAKEVSE